MHWRNRYIIIIDIFKQQLDGQPRFARGLLNLGVLYRLLCHTSVFRVSPEAPLPGRFFPVAQDIRCRQSIKALNRQPSDLGSNDPLIYWRGPCFVAFRAGRSDLLPAARQLLSALSGV
jgi:hypothetical protein